MRPIEFRGVRQYGKQLVFGYLTSNDEINGFQVIPESIGQFTGLLDKNGTKIFEGDIFHLSNKLDNNGRDIFYIVEFRDGSFIGRQKKNKSSVGLSWWQKNIEVIGNIHENPQLLL